MEAMRLQMISMKIRMGELEIKVDENTTLTQEIKTDTAAIRDFFNDAAGGARILIRLGKVARWFAPFVTIGAGIAAWYHVLTNAGVGK